MKPSAKLLLGLSVVIISCGAFMAIQEQRAAVTVESVRTSLAVGDSKEKVEQVMRAHGLQPEVGDGGRLYVAHVWRPFRNNASVTVVLNGHWEVGMIFVESSRGRSNSH